MLYRVQRCKAQWSVVLSVGMLLFSGSPSFAEANIDGPNLQANRIQSSFGFTPPPSNGQPRTTRAGGKRDQLCNQTTPTTPLRLLLPPSNEGHTTAAHPSFQVYIPETAAQNVFWKLEDQEGQYHYHTVQSIPQGSGIVTVKMPETAPALESGQSFKVSLAVICGTALDPSDPVVEGWITRIAPTSTLVANPEMSLARVADYAQNGVWFDAVNTLAELLRSQPNNPAIETAWEELLTSVGLESIETAKLLEPIAPEG